MDDATSADAIAIDVYLYEDISEGSALLKCLRTLSED